MKFEVRRISEQYGKDFGSEKRIVEINSLAEFIDFFKKAEAETIWEDENGDQVNWSRQHHNPDAPDYIIEIVDDYIA